jgi:hypothetical protein
MQGDEAGPSVSDLTEKIKVLKAAHSVFRGFLVHLELLPGATLDRAKARARLDEHWTKVQYPSFPG